jgi:NADPH-dependent glutamate synthase beta subunit-like oxidoreductase
MKYASYFAATASLIATLPLVLAAPTNNPVCIIGAGPAGLTAAQKLESKGRKVVMFEKQAAVGGKCQAVYAE